MLPADNPASASVAQQACVASLLSTSESVSNDRIPIMVEDAKDDDKPVFVNAKQYHRILKRRQARAKLEASGKIPKIRKVCSTANVLPVKK